MTTKKLQGNRLSDVQELANVLKRIELSESSSEENFYSSPFFTITIRTQGLRPEQLMESLLCVGSQDFEDFELVVVCHSPVEKALSSVKELISKFPTSLTSKTRLVSVKAGGRSAPLNAALKEGKGSYFLFLDDDDYVLPDWLSVFHDLARDNPGRILRAQCVLQNYERSKSFHPEFSRAISEPWIQYNPAFSLIEHLISNQSPFMTLAFPRTVVDDLNFAFDEDLSTTEDWDFLLRSASILGVGNSKEVTSVYRKWRNLSTSHQIPKYEWFSNIDKIAKKLERQFVILYPGEVAELYKVFYSRENELAVVKNREALRGLIETMDSRSWRWTAPLRALIGIIKGRQRISMSMIDTANSEQVNQLNKMIRSSFWWRATSFLRSTK